MIGLLNSVCNVFTKMVGIASCGACTTPPASFEEQASDLLDEVNDLVEENNRLKEKTDELQRELDKVDTQTASSGEELVRKEELVHKLKEQMDELEIEKAKYKASSDVLAQRAAELQNDLQAAEECLEAEADRSKDLEEKLTKFKKGGGKS